MKALHENFALVKDKRSIDANEVFSVLQKTRAFGDGKAFDNLIKAITVASNVFRVINPDVLVKARNAAKAIIAESFPTLTGKELGDALKAARVKEIDLVLGGDLQASCFLL